MKIVHICMVDAFSEGWAYHRNIISDKNKADGHDVTIITTKYRMRSDGKCELDKPGVFYTKTGVKIVRLENIVSGLPMAVMDRLHWTKGLYKALEQEKPDIIMVHNLQFVNLYLVAKYRKKHNDMRLIGDTHSDRFVSIGKNPKKSIFVNKRIWGPVIRRNFKQFDRFCYIGLEQKQFFEEMYNISLENAMLAPLPAPIVSEKDKEKARDKIRKKHDIKQDEKLFVHSGKLVPRKKTKELLIALRQIPLKCKLLIIGDIPPESMKELNALIDKDRRVEYLGWKSGDELREYISAADLYLQPGTMSITMQNALCAGTPVMIYPHDSYKYYCNGCEFIVKTTEDIERVFKGLSENGYDLNDMSRKAYEVANQYFSIDNAAKILYEVFE